MFKKVPFFCLLFLITAFLSHAQVREKFNFNPDWKLKVFDDSLAFQSNYNDESWKTISLPHAWNENDAFSGW